ncbi:MAG: calcium-binding protein [Hyphomicrobiales bacterium]
MFFFGSTVTNQSFLPNFNTPISDLISDTIDANRVEFTEFEIEDADNLNIVDSFVDFSRQGIRVQFNASGRFTNAGPDGVNAAIFTFEDNIIRNARLIPEESTFDIPEEFISFTSNTVTYDVNNLPLSSGEFFTIRLDLQLIGGDGIDVITSGVGDDLISGGAGGDILNGDDGIDTLTYAASDAGVVVNLFNGFARGGEATGDVFTNFENLTGSRSTDVLRGDVGENEIFGFDGNDRIEGREGNDVLIGGSGNDLLLGGSGNDRLIASSGDNRLNGQSGNDTLIGGTGADRLLGAAGDDLLIASGGVNNVLDGGSGSDILNGSEQRDIIRGQAGADIFDGGGGNDALTGGFGPDTFIFNANDGGDVINDFEDNFDTIDLSSLGTDFASLTLSIIGGDDALIDYGSGSIRLRDFDVNDLDTGDFDFV